MGGRGSTTMAPRGRVLGCSLSADCPNPTLLPWAKSVFGTKRACQLTIFASAFDPERTRAQEVRYRELLMSHHRRTGRTTNRRTPMAAAAAIHGLPSPILIATKIPKATAAAKTAMVLAATPKLIRISPSHVGSVRPLTTGISERASMAVSPASIHGVGQGGIAAAPEKK
jgi:hypothetical protein